LDKRLICCFLRRDFFQLFNLDSKFSKKLNMKKIIIALLFLAGIFGFTNAGAQQKVKKTAPAKTTTVKPKDSTTIRKTGLKKDGTADMRYKENKNAAKVKPVGPLKKDSTPDMRYKANKVKAKTK
jgi:hypothetical protein